MNDAILSWQKQTVAGATPTGYVVNWTYNGTALAPQTVPVTAAGDASGYSLDFATANPTVTVSPGDVIGATIDTVDATNNLQSAAVPSVPATVTEPAAPPVAPGPPQNVTLVLA
jgi:hypothetical protein